MHDNKLVAYIRQAVDTSDPQQASQDLAQLARDIDVTTPKLEDKDVGRAIENGGSEAAAAAAAGKKKEAGQPSYAEVAGSSPGSKVVAKGKKGQQNEKVVVTTTKKGAAQKPIKARSTAAAPLTWTEWLRTIVLGLSSRSRKVNLWALGLHTLLLLWFLDSYAAPYLFPSHYEYNLHFARVAALGPTEAKLSFRYPHPLPPLDGILEDMQSETGGGIAGTGPGVLGEEANPEPMRVVWREASGPGGLMGSDLFGRQVARRWERGPLVRLTEEADWTATVRLAGLWPATEYEFRLAWTHNNSFTPYPPTSRRFVTFPDPRLSSANSLAHSEQLDGESTEVRPRSENRNPLDDPNHFTFAVTSCVRPDTPWLPTQFWAWNWLLKAFGIGNEPGGIAQRNRIQGFDILAEQLLEGWGHVSDGGRRRGSGLRFLLTLGDTIYADVPTGSSTIQHYRKLYRNLFASASFRRVYEAIPVFGIYDDHEVENNWAGATDDGEVLPAFPPANTAWQEYIGRGNPDPLEPGQNWYSFRYGDSAFFVTDTRLYRSPASKEDNEEKTMLGEIQREALMAWLGAVNSTSTFKFVISSVPFMSLWGGPLDVDGKKDSWAAYMTERAALLDVMQYVPNVIILSGDRHEFAAATMRTAVLEFSTSPLNMFCEWPKRLVAHW